MACILYTYSVTSIRAAKRNAALHREADGGQFDLRRESLRRHGVLEPVKGTSGIELFRDSGRDVEKAKIEMEEMGDKNARPLGNVIRGGDDQDAVAREGRTRVEDGLEGFKGRGAASRRFRDGKPLLEKVE